MGQFQEADRSEDYRVNLWPVLIGRRSRLSRRPMSIGERVATMPSFGFAETAAE